MKKILTALLALLALVMALSLSACGGGSGDLTVEQGTLHMSPNAEFSHYPASYTHLTLPTIYSV